MSHHDVATLLIAAAFYAAGIWTVLMWHRSHRTPRHYSPRHGVFVVDSPGLPEGYTPPSGSLTPPDHKETDHA